MRHHQHYRETEYTECLPSAELLSLPPNNRTCVECWSVYRANAQLYMIKWLMRFDDVPWIGYSFFSLNVCIDEGNCLLLRIYGKKARNERIKMKPFPLISWLSVSGSDSDPKKGILRCTVNDSKWTQRKIRTINTRTLGRQSTRKIQ